MATKNENQKSNTQKTYVLKGQGSTGCASLLSVKCFAELIKIPLVLTIHPHHLQSFQLFSINQPDQKFLGSSTH